MRMVNPKIVTDLMHQSAVTYPPFAEILQSRPGRRRLVDGWDHTISGRARLPDKSLW